MIINGAKSKLSQEIIEIHTHEMLIKKVENRLEVTNIKGSVIFDINYMFNVYRINLNNFLSYFIKRNLDIYYLIIIYKTKIRIYKIYKEVGSDFSTIFKLTNIKFEEKNPMISFNDKLHIIYRSHICSYNFIIEKFSVTKEVQRIVWKKCNFICSIYFDKYKYNVYLYYFDQTRNFFETILTIYLNQKNYKHSNFYSFCEDLNDYVLENFDQFIDMRNDKLRSNARNKVFRIIERYI